jgi:hypothetical protein
MESMKLFLAIVSMSFVFQNYMAIATCKVGIEQTGYSSSKEILKQVYHRYAPVFSDLFFSFFEEVEKNEEHKTITDYFNNVFCYIGCDEPYIIKALTVLENYFIILRKVDINIGTMNAGHMTYISLLAFFASIEHSEENKRTVFLNYIKNTGCDLVAFLGNKTSLLSTLNQDTNLRGVDCKRCENLTKKTSNERQAEFKKECEEARKLDDIIPRVAAPVTI